MIHLHDIAYVRIGATDIEASAAFARDCVGLQPCGKSNGQRYFRSDERMHTLCLFEGDPSDQTIGFEVDSAAELDAAAIALESLGHAVRRGTSEERETRAVRDLIAFQDPSGNKLEFVLRQAVSGVRFTPQREVDIRGFNHVGLYSPDVVRDELFWTTVCNARVSDRIGDVPLMRVNAIHHTIALAPSAHAGLHHINHQVADTDDVMRSYYFLTERKVPIVFGPGRHPTSSARFIYFRGPDRIVYEYSVGVDEIENEAEHRPRQFSAEPWSLCQWGAIWDPAVS